MRVVLASGNTGKLREFSDLLGRSGLQFEPQSVFGIESPDETGSSFLENALIKARHVARCTGLPAMADDSGLEVDALSGAPGVWSARYAGVGASDAANIDKLLVALEGVPEAGRGARFRCVIVLLQSADDPAPRVGEGSWVGRILRARRGAGGFGYDSVFADAATGLSAAELPSAQKHARSHRGQALQSLLRQLRPA